MIKNENYNGIVNPLYIENNILNLVYVNPIIQNHDADKILQYQKKKQHT